MWDSRPRCSAAESRFASFYLSFNRWGQPPCGGKLARPAYAGQSAAVASVDALPDFVTRIATPTDPAVGPARVAIVTPLLSVAGCRLNINTIKNET